MIKEKDSQMPRTENHKISTEKNLQIDTLQNGYKILQDPTRFMFGIDAVLLSAFAAKKIKKSERIIDLGTGTGIIPLLLEPKIHQTQKDSPAHQAPESPQATMCPPKESSQSAKIIGLEIQKDSADMAATSVAENNLQEKIKIVNGDIKNVAQLFPKHSFDSITSNPPYMVCGQGWKNPGDAKAIARHEVFCTLDDLIKAADFLLRPRGKFFLIHRPSRLAEIFAALSKYKLEPKRMQLVQPFENKEANLVLIEARKNAQSGLRLEPTLNVRNPDGTYTKEIEEIYKSLK